MRAASPIPVTAGSPRSQQLRCGFLRQMPEKTARSNSRRALPPRAPPRCSVDVPLCGIRSAAEALSGARRRKPHDPIRGGPCTSGTPRCSVDVSLCGIRRAAEALSDARRRKPHDPIRGGPCPLEHPRCSVDVPLCGIRSAAEALSGECRRKPQNPIRGGPCPLERPCCFIVACMEWEARQKKRPPQSRGSGAGTVCLIRRETAAGTRAGCSSPPRTAKRHRRERACPCRSR